ncbi:MAG: hypothetical protein JNK15_06300 [Planctomycetes bacterium]|nr:hypothetical protein [Planctomycetota bacterium]
MAHHDHHAPGQTHDPLPIDPERDIDAKSATIWFVGSAIVIFLSLWLMVPIFMRVLDHELKQKVDLAPNTELIDVRAEEAEFLNGGNPKKKKIADVVAGLRK